MENISEYMKISYAGKDGNFDVYIIGCNSLSIYDLNLITNYCRENKYYMVLDLLNKRILTLKLK